MRGVRTSGGRGRVSMRVPVIVAAASMLMLSGCTSTAPAPPDTSAGATPTVAPTAGTAGPTLHPDGSAAENLPLFSAVVARVWASDARASAPAYIEALASAGFAKADMQMTADTTTVHNPAESFQFSVRWGATQCFVGQVGPSTGAPVTAVLPQLANGRCLVGRTPPVGG
ncbi:DUF6993 domain-containing protein [Microbacterium sp. ASV81]|uniref:DUF6993 domain-containing protein n=1 Tax=Microbacterium capsulatum TaxID=3041921 RepID=A0ABU0XC02_9MICO|nr:hypothetical protein [Microbacterium sp. ASV81]MDQ4212636.1 hypothetical protein [Microbacterium sp. ASV81]